MEGGARRWSERAPEFLFAGAVVYGSGESKGKIKVPCCGCFGLEVGRERAGGATQVPRVAKRCFYYIHKQ